MAERHPGKSNIQWGHCEPIHIVVSLWPLSTNCHLCCRWSRIIRHICWIWVVGRPIAYRRISGLDRENAEFVSVGWQEIHNTTWWTKRRKNPTRRIAPMRSNEQSYRRIVQTQVSTQGCGNRHAWHSCYRSCSFNRSRQIAQSARQHTKNSGVLSSWILQACHITWWNMANRFFLLLESSCRFYRAVWHNYHSSLLFWTLMCTSVIRNTLLFQIFNSAFIKTVD